MDKDAMKKNLLSGPGYANPPKHGQFRKGQSGNPRGRPKKATSDLSLTDQPTLSAMLSTAMRTVQVREDGGTSEMSLREAVIRSTFASAAKGNARSQALTLDLLRKGDEARAQQIRRSNEFWRDYKSRVAAQIAEARKQGLPPPSPLPHPDDIVIDHDQGPRFLGPIDEAEQAIIEENVRFRDLLMMQDELDRRCLGIPRHEVASAELVARMMEDELPVRFRLPEMQWLFRIMKYQGMPRRVLLKQLHEGWRRLGNPLPRGFVFPELDWWVPRIRMVNSVRNDIRRLKLDPLTMTDKEWSDAILALVKTYIEVEQSGEG